MKHFTYIAFWAILFTTLILIGCSEQQDEVNPTENAENSQALERRSGETGGSGGISSLDEIDGWVTLHNVPSGYNLEYPSSYNYDEVYLMIQSGDTSEVYGFSDQTDLDDVERIEGSSLDWGVDLSTGNFNCTPEGIDCQSKGSSEAFVVHATVD